MGRRCLRLPISPGTRNCALAGDGENSCKVKVASHVNIATSHIKTKTSRLVLSFEREMYDFVDVALMYTQLKVNGLGIPVFNLWRRKFGNVKGTNVLNTGTSSKEIYWCKHVTLIESQRFFFFGLCLRYIKHSLARGYARSKTRFDWRSPC